MDEKLERVSNSESANTAKPSLYSMLCGVATMTVLQFVLLSLGHQTAGGRTDMYDEKAAEDIEDFDKRNVSKLLMRIPTRAWNANSTSINLFPIHDMDLNGWKSHFQKVGFDELSAGIVNCSNRDQRQLDVQYHDLLRGAPMN